MKRPTTILMVLLASWLLCYLALGQPAFQLVDVTTLSYSTNTSAAQITITNEGAGTVLTTNAHYWAIKTNNLNFGEPPSNGWTKVNWNWLALSNYLHTNQPAGTSTNFLLGGTIGGPSTNNGITSLGTNQIIAIIANSGLTNVAGSLSNALPNLNGLGTNENFFGVTTLNASNILIYNNNENGLLIPLMTNSTLPSGVVTSSDDPTNYLPFCECLPYMAFNPTLPYVNSYTSQTETNPWVQYQFPYSVTVTGWVGNIQGNLSTNQISASTDGINWTVVYYDTAANIAGAIPSTTASYWRFTGIRNTATYAQWSGLNLSGPGMDIVADTNNLLQFIDPVGIDLETTNFTLNGQPFGTFIVNEVVTNTSVINNYYTNTVSQGGGTVFPTLWVTNCAGAAAVLNGPYTASIPGTYTNWTTLGKILSPGSASGSHHTPTCYLIGTNLSGIHGLFDYEPVYTNSTLTGFYSVTTNNATLCPTNQPQVGIGLPAFTGSKAYLAPGGATNWLNITNGLIY